MEIIDQIEEVLTLAMRQRDASHVAASCGTKRDYAKYREAEEAYEEAREAMENIIRELVATNQRLEHTVAAMRQIVAV